MKKLLLAICMLFSLSAAHAQDIYNYIYNKANTAINNDNGTNESVFQLNYFYLTELTYLKRKALEKNGETTTKFLDTQALGMKEFVELYIQKTQEASNISKKKGKDMTTAFIKASLRNPLFNDEDQELVLSFMNDSDYPLTPFSLDTDWEKALDYMKIKAKEILSE